MDNIRRLIPLAALLCCCSAPLYYDRAEILPGLSAGVGAGVMTGEAVSGESQSTHLPYTDYYNAIVGSLYLQYGFPSKPTAFFFQASG